MRLSTEDGVLSARKPLPSRPFHRLPIDSRLQVRHYCLVSFLFSARFSFLFLFFLTSFNFIPFHRSEGIKTKTILSDRVWNATPNRRWKRIWDKRQWRRMIEWQFDSMARRSYSEKKRKEKKNHWEFFA